MLTVWPLDVRFMQMSELWSEVFADSSKNFNLKLDLVWVTRCMGDELSFYLHIIAATASAVHLYSRPSINALSLAVAFFRIHKGKYPLSSAGRAGAHYGLVYV